MPTPAPTPHLFALIPAALALVVRAIVLAAETSQAAVGRERAAELVEHSRAAKVLLRLEQDQERTVASVRAASTLALAVAAALVAYVAMDFGRQYRGDATWWALGGAAATWLVTVFTDILPRSVAASRPEPWALRTARFVYLIRILLAPFTRSVSALTNLILHPLGMKVRFSAPPLPLDELERMLRASPDKDAPEPALVRQLFEFGDRTVKEIMIPRTDVVAIPLDASPQAVIQSLLDDGHTRLPVYKGTLDTIVGILLVKDVLPLLTNPELIILHDLLRPTLFVPWNKPIPLVLRELQKQSQHLAVVVDEYGGMAGLVTLEDIVEQLVGDIRDELDDEPPEVVPAGEGVSLVRGDLRVGEFNRLFSTTVPDDQGFETMGGFLSSLAGAIPGENDRFYHGGLELTVAKRDPKRVLEIRVTRVRAGPAASTGEARV